MLIDKGFPLVYINGKSLQAHTERQRVDFQLFCTKKHAIDTQKLFLELLLKMILLQPPDC